MNKYFALLTLVLSCTSLNAVLAYGSDTRSIQDFSIVRSGGGAGSILVSANMKSGSKKVVAATTSCNFRPLSPVEQTKTSLVLKGATAAEALAILNDQATLAERVILKPAPLTGTWVSLVVDYVDSQSRKLNQETIKDPIVLLNGQDSMVLSDIEIAAREAAITSGVCK